MPKLIFILSFLFSAWSAEAQALIKKFELKDETAVTDELGNLYLYNQKEIKKFDREGTLVATYSNRESGDISYIDVSDPLKILVFSKALATAVYLDNRLSYTFEIFSFPEIEIFNPLIAAKGNENFIWVFDAGGNTLQKISFDRSNRVGTPDLNNLFGLSDSLTMMVEENNRLFLCREGRGIFVFDQFGNFVNTIPSSEARVFQVRNETLVYRNNSKLMRYDLRTGEESEIMSIGEGIKDVLIEKERLFLIKKNSLEIYRVDN